MSKKISVRKLTEKELELLKKSAGKRRDIPPSIHLPSDKKFDKFCREIGVK